MCSRWNVHVPLRAYTPCTRWTLRSPSVGGSSRVCPQAYQLTQDIITSVSPIRMSSRQALQTATFSVAVQSRVRKWRCVNGVRTRTRVGSRHKSHRRCRWRADFLCTSSLVAGRCFSASLLCAISCRMDTVLVVELSQPRGLDTRWMPGCIGSTHLAREVTGITLVGTIVLVSAAGHVSLVVTWSRHPNEDFRALVRF